MVGYAHFVGLDIFSRKDPNERMDPSGRNRPQVVRMDPSGKNRPGVGIDLNEKNRTEW